MQNTQFPSLAQQPKHTATEMQSGTAHQRPQSRHQKTQATEMQSGTAHQRPVETTKNTGHRNTVCYSLSMSTVETTHTKKSHRNAVCYSLSTSTVETTPALCTFFGVSGTMPHVLTHQPNVLINIYNTIKVASSNPCWNGGRIVFSCQLCVPTHIWCPFHPCVTPVACKRPRSFCQMCRLHLNMHTSLTQQSRSGLTMPLSRHSEGTYQERAQT